MLEGAKEVVERTIQVGTLAGYFEFRNNVILNSIKSIDTKFDDKDTLLTYLHAYSKFASEFIC